MSDSLWEEDEAPRLINSLETPTETIDLDDLLTTDVTKSGSFNVGGEIWATTFGKVMQSLPIPALLVGRSHNIFAVNEACGKIGRDYKLILETCFFDLFPSRSVARKIRSLIEEIFLRRKPQTVEAVLTIGKIRTWARMSLRSIRIKDERFVLALVEDLTAQKKQQMLLEEHRKELMRMNEQLVQEINRRKESEKQREKLISDLTAATDALRFRATHDELTGVWNRSAILEMLGKEIARCKREGTTLGVILGDVDYFKRINDQHGHLAGDEALREIARRIVSSLRPYDLVGRYGGEEFLVILPGCDRENARHMAERLRSRFQDHAVETREGAFSITLSLGVGGLDKTSEQDVNAVVRAADDALYRAKELGRNRVELG